MFVLQHKLNLNHAVQETTPNLPAFEPLTACDFQYAIRRKKEDTEKLEICLKDLAYRVTDAFVNDAHIPEMLMHEVFELSKKNKELRRKENPKCKAGKKFYSNFYDGKQTLLRSRMVFKFSDLKSGKNLSGVIEENLVIIREACPGFAKGFKPNVVIALRFAESAYLLPHKNEKIKGVKPFVAVLPIGNSCKYTLIPPNDIRLNEFMSIHGISFPLHSQEMLVFQGELVMHGVKGCVYNCDEAKKEGQKKGYRMAFCCFEVEADFDGSFIFLIFFLFFIMMLRCKKFLKNLILVREIDMLSMWRENLRSRLLKRKKKLES